MTTTPTTDNATTTTTAQPVQQPEAQPQPATAQNAETKPKLQYFRIHLCRAHDDRHCSVLFTDGSRVELQNFDDIGRACQIMGDDESARKFMADVAMFQDEGRLQDLLSPEEQLKLGRSQAREALLKNLQARRMEMHEKFHQLTKIAKLSTYALAKPVMDSLQATLLKPELEKYFQEMSERGWSICIKLEMPKNPCAGPDSDDDVEFNINPEDLVSKDISEELAEFEEEHAEFREEIAKLGF